MTAVHIAGPESELSDISSFTVAAAEALINLYHGHSAIATNHFGHPANLSHTVISYPVSVEEVDDVDRKLHVSRVSL